MQLKDAVLRQAGIVDLSNIMDIINFAILKRKQEGSTQWQDGYPNTAVIQQDIISNNAYVGVVGDTIIGYAAVIFEDDPSYGTIEGAWLNTEPYVVIHRLAVSQTTVYKGIGTWMMQAIEDLVVNRGYHNIKVDTNYDNDAMRRVFDKLGYLYCGEVIMRTGIRMAFQKVFDIS